MSKRAIILRINECRQMINDTENEVCRLAIGLITFMHLVLASVLMHHNTTCRPALQMLATSVITFLKISP